MADHLHVAKESTAGTFVTPSGDNVSGLQTFAPVQGDTRVERRESGRARAAVANRQGIHNPNGTITTVIEPDNMGLFLIASGFDDNAVSTPSGGTNSRDHGFAIDDDAAVSHLSMQIQQTRLGATTTVNLRGVRLNGFTISVAVDQHVTLSFPYMAIEHKLAGGNFADGNSSPAAVAISYGTLAREFTFEQLTVKYGVTPTWDGTNKIFSFSGGTTLSDVEDLTIAVDQGLTPRHTLGSRYPQAIVDGDRASTVQMTIRNDSPATTFHDKFMAGTQEAWQFLFAGATDAIESGFTNEFEIVIPNLDYTAAPIGDLNMNSGARNTQVTGLAILDGTSSQDITFRLRNTVTSAY